MDRARHIVRSVQWSLAGGLIANVSPTPSGVPLLARLPPRQNAAGQAPLVRHPAARIAVATLVATVGYGVELGRPQVSGIIALFPIVFTSMMLILHPASAARRPQLCSPTAPGA